MLDSESELGGQLGDQQGPKTVFSFVKLAFSAKKGIFKC